MPPLRQSPNRYPHSRKKLEKPAQDAGSRARAGTPHEAAQNADAITVAVHWSRMDDVLKQAGRRKPLSATRSLRSHRCHLDLT
ncbi:MAG TPA: NAD(P)-binding domain-containing protein [Nitrospira sp.]|nr:NAD(P)-binding domain-containing protein [Nitrospira sp.]